MDGGWDLAEWLGHLTANAKLATILSWVLSQHPPTQRNLRDVQIKQCWIKYLRYTTFLAGSGSAWIRIDFGRPDPDSHWNQGCGSPQHWHWALIIWHCTTISIGRYFCASCHICRFEHSGPYTWWALKSTYQMWIESLSCLILLFQMSAPPAGYTVHLTYLDVQADRLD